MSRNYIHRFMPTRTHSATLLISKFDRRTSCLVRNWQTSQTILVFTYLGIRYDAVQIVTLLILALLNSDRISTDADTLYAFVAG